MYMKSMSWISVVALAPAVFLVSSTNYRIALQFIVCWSAAMIVIQSFRSGKYGWAAAFCAVAVAFNPIIPFTIPAPVFGWVAAGCRATKPADEIARFKIVRHRIVAMKRPPNSSLSR